MIKVDRNVPMPKRAANEQIYPWQQLRVGDSFLVPLAGREAKAVQQHMHARARMHGMRFRTAREGDAIRCWRYK